MYTDSNILIPGTQIPIQNHNNPLNIEVIGHTYNWNYTFSNFFVITNFGVWSLGSYEYNINGLINCYTLALPFFTYNLISTLIFAAIIETLYKTMLLKKISILNKN